MGPDRKLIISDLNSAHVKGYKELGRGRLASRLLINNATVIGIFCLDHLIINLSNMFKDNTIKQKESG